MEDDQLIASADRPKVMTGTVETNEAFDELLEIMRTLTDADEHVAWVLSGQPRPNPDDA